MQNSGLVLFVCAGLLLVRFLYILTSKDEVGDFNYPGYTGTNTLKTETQTAKSGGAILGGSTAWSLVRISYYFWTTDLGVELASSILYISGALICLPTGWLATLVPYHPRSLPVPATLLILASSGIVLLAAGMSSVTALSHALRENAPINASMQRSLGAADPTVQSAFAAMQLELHCCGVDSYSDWYRHRSALPPSCCGRVTNAKGESCDSSVYGSGCLRRVSAELRAYINAHTILASVMVLVLAVTLFAGAYTLVSSAVERGAGKPAQALHLACVAAPHLAPLPHLQHLAPTPAPHM